MRSLGNQHEIEVFVRFCETDAVGHVNNTSYFLYFEEARTKFFQEIFKERNQKFNMILASIKCDYLHQAYASESLIVRTKVIDVGTKSFKLSHELVNKLARVPIAYAECVSVCFDYETQQSVPIPEELKQRLHANQMSFANQTDPISNPCSG